MIFGEKLNEVLKNNGISQKEFAEEIGSTPSNVSAYVKGRNLPPLEKFCDICDILNVSPNYLLNYNETCFDDLQFYDICKIIRKRSNDWNKEQKAELICLLIGED